MPAKPFDYFWDSLTDEKGAKERANYVLKSISEYHKKAKKKIHVTQLRDWL